MRRVEGKVALVTGAASRPGIGFSIAERLAEEGAITILTDIDEKGCNQSVEILTGRNLTAESMKQNVAVQEDWDRVVREIIERHSRLNILVNNAGILDIAAVEDERLIDGLRQQFEVNVAGSLMGTQAAVRAMRKSGGGSIINLSSVAGKVGFAASSGYTASKGAVKLMSKSVALETAAENIRINTVHPGIIHTNMQIQAVGDNSDNYAAIEASIPMRRLGDPRDIANCVLFLASDEASYITGAEFVVDGGYTAR